GVNAYACSGTPADCVKMATGVVLHRKPDLVLSGVNHGLNASISVFYSGTMSAAMEGAIEGIPSFGFSLADYSPDADFSAAERIVEIVLKNHFHYGTPENIALNINIPKLPLEQIKGIKVCRQAYGRWVEEFDERTDPHGRRYWWLAGRFNLTDEGSDTDIWAIENGYVSICPVNIDATAHHALPHINRWKIDNLNLTDVRETAPHFVEITPPE
ncbi:MAG: 5'/3'-nucleotidase SurE, partial [Bacteroidia bacterium]|nr:5'/3'-nucleotidase SurE [Bacteroidia bacterium]